MRPILRVAGAFVVVACLAGCGGSGSGPLTAAQLATQGSAICARAASEEKALDVTSMAVALPRLEAIGNRENTDLSKLSAPANEQASYHALLSEASQVVSLLRSLESAIAGGGNPPPELLARGRELTRRLAALDGPLGMGVCSAAASPS